MAKEDQADILASNEKLTKDLSAAQGEVETLKASVTKLEGERDTHKAAADKANASLSERDASLATVTSERDSLKAENTKLKESQAEFDKKVAAECLKHGVNISAIETPKTNSKPLTATEKVHAAKAAK